MSIDWARVLLGASMVLAAAGVALRVAPIRLEVESAPPIVAAAPTPPPGPLEQAQALLWYQEIIDRNIFSRNRRAPATRYVPPEMASGAAPVQPGPRPAFRPRLFGVAVGPSGAVALIDAEPDIPGAEVYRPGDAVGDARLAAIEDTAVVLEGPGGRIVLTLPSLSRR